MSRQRSVIPWLFVAGMGIVVAVNSYMAWLAVKTAPGMVTDRPYERGAAYNEVLAKGEAQDALGWKAEVSVTPHPPLGATIRLRFRDAAGKGLPGLALSAELVRPVEPLPHVPLRFAEAGAGTYSAEATIPRPGQWDLFVIARRGKDEFDDLHRLQLR